MKFLVISFVHLLLIQLSFGAKESAEECQKLVRKADNCMKVVFFIGETAVIAKNSEEYNAYCNRANSAINCVKRLRPCLDKFPRSILDIFIRGIKKTYNRNCKTATAVTEFIKLSNCVEASLPNLYGCLDEAVKQFYYLAKNASSIDVMPLSCCAFHNVYKCVEGGFQCGNQTKQVTNWMTGIVDDIFKDILEIVCAKQNSLQECRKQLPTQLAALEKAAKSKNLNLANMFILEPLLMYAERLSS